MPVFMNLDGKLYQGDLPSGANHCLKPFVRPEVENLLTGEVPQSVEVLQEVLTFAKDDATFIPRLKQFNEDARKAKAPKEE